MNGTGEHVVLQHNVCGPYIAVHYFQVGNGSHITIDHNLFLGPSARHDSESHQNYLQIAGASSDVEFSDNIMWHTNAENGLEVERYSAATEAEEYEDFTVTNNLEVHNGDSEEDPEAPGGIGMDFCPVRGMTFEHNTIVEPSSTGANFRAEGTGVSECHAGERYRVEHNLLTLAPGANQPLLSVHEGACEAACEVDYNVTQDSSATGAHSIEDWAPAWETTTWDPETEPRPPSGYYTPAPGSLSITAGYEGDPGPWAPGADAAARGARAVGGALGREARHGPGESAGRAPRPRGGRPRPRRWSGRQRREAGDPRQALTGTGPRRGAEVLACVLLARVCVLGDHLRAHAALARVMDDRHLGEMADLPAARA